MISSRLTSGKIPFFVFFMLAITVCMPAGATITLSTSSSDYAITNIFSNVDFFSITIEIDGTLRPGVYADPTIVSVEYQVTGELEPGTPSGFATFDLQRSITGDEFYAQGSSLSFEIAQSAVLSDGVQLAELVGGGVVLTFDGREVDNGRFHPALLELSSDGTGRIQNSNNVPSLNPPVEVDFGSEYITDLAFDTGNTTVLTGDTSTGPLLGGGGGAIGPWETLALTVAWMLAAARRRFRVARG